MRIPSAFGRASSFIVFHEALNLSSPVSVSLEKKSSMSASSLSAAFSTSAPCNSAALSASKEGSRKEAAEKNKAKSAVNTILQQLCGLVNFVAEGDRIKLLGSGFDISKDIETPVVIEPAKNVIINYGSNTGEMNVAVKGVKGHKGLVFEYAVATENNELADDSIWISKPSSTTQCTIANMPVGRRVLIRIGVAGPRKQLVYTIPVVRLVA